MNDSGFAPTISTLNIILALLTRMPNFRDRRKNALKMISEVKQFGVEPSLGSYHYLLQIFCADSGKLELILNWTNFQTRIVQNNVSCNRYSTLTTFLIIRVHY